MIKSGLFYVNVHTECNTTLLECPFDMSSRSAQYVYKLTQSRLWEDLRADRTIYVLENKPQSIDFKINILNFYNYYDFM